MDFNLNLILFLRPRCLSRRLCWRLRACEPETSVFGPKFAPKCRLREPPSQPGGQVKVAQVMAVAARHARVMIIVVSSSASRLCVCVYLKQQLTL